MTESRGPEWILSGERLEMLMSGLGWMANECALSPKNERLYSELSDVLCRLQEQEQVKP